MGYNSGHSTTAGRVETYNESLLAAAKRDAKRLKDVLVIIARHGFGELLLKLPFSSKLTHDASVEASGESGQETKKSAAQRFKKLLEDLGPTYIKFGQVLSMRPDFLPQDFVKALEGLQDKAPAIPFSDIRLAIEQGLGQSIQDLFLDFDPSPLASASISQVHLARTKGGDKVVVKVQRPGIEQIMRGDLDLLYLVAKVLEASIEEVQVIAPSEALSEFEKALVRELNFNEELGNLIHAESLLDPERSVIVPRPYPELSCKTVLTMQFFQGKSVREIPPGSELAEHVATEIMHAGIKQVVVDGFFHGDPHAGNILYNNDGDVCMIDLGLAGRLTDSQRAEMVSLFFGIVTFDAGTVARTLLRMGTPTQRVNINDLRAVTARLMDKYLRVERMDELRTSDLAQELVNEAQKFKIKLATEYVVLAKAAMSIESIVTTLYPELDIIAIGKPYLEKTVSKRFSWRNVVSDSIGGVMGLGSLLRQVPVQLEQILHDTETGNIQIHAITPKLNEVPDLIHQLASRITLMGFAFSMTLTATLLAVIETPESRHPFMTAFCIFMSCISWGYLWLWHLLGRGKPFRLRSITQFFRR
jgi:ubiquinone biosynthesis protein